MKKDDLKLSANNDFVSSSLAFCKYWGMYYSGPYDIRANKVIFYNVFQKETVV
jgi:hypothetical protein